MILVVEHEERVAAGRLARALGPLEVLRPHRGEPLPEDAERAGYTGLLVLGGSAGADADERWPWLPATRRLLAAAVRSQLPTLGVCLGGQLLARATGGVVERGGCGYQIGLLPVGLTAAAVDDGLFGWVREELGEQLVVPQWHQDVVSRLPADAELLATGATYPVQAFRVGPAAWGLQYHPEVTQEGLIGWLRAWPEQATAAGVDVPALATQILTGEPGMAAVAAAHAASFAALVNARDAARRRPVDRR